MIKILKITVCITMLLAAAMNGYTQSYEVRVPYDGSPITKDITFRSSCGAVGEVVVPIEFRRNQSDNAFTMTFKQTRNRNEFICLFGGDFSMRAVENARHDIAFDRATRRCDNGRIRKFYDNPGPQTPQAIDVVQCIELSREDFTIIFNQPAWNGIFYAYIAIEDRNRVRQVQYLAKVHFNISVEENPCESEIARETIQKLNEHNNELRLRTTALNRELHRLVRLTCEDYRSESAQLNPKDRKSEDDFPHNCDFCYRCSDFVDVKNNLHYAIERYNDSVDIYNLLLEYLAEKFRDPCPRPTTEVPRPTVVEQPPAPTCRCDCARLRATFQEIRQLIIELQTGQRDRADIERRFNNLPTSFCTGNCRNADCDSCRRCGNDYEAYREAHRRLSELLR